MTTLVKVQSMVKVVNICQGDNFGQKRKLRQLRPEKENLRICRPESKTLASVGQKKKIGICRPEKKTSALLSRNTSVLLNRNKVLKKLLELKKENVSEIFEKKSQNIFFPT